MLSSLPCFYAFCWSAIPTSGYIFNVFYSCIISNYQDYFIMLKSKLAKCHKLTLSASTKCPGGHYVLAVSVRTPDTIRESGRDLLQYRIGHYPRPDAICCSLFGPTLVLTPARADFSCRKCSLTSRTIAGRISFLFWIVVERPPSLVNLQRRSQRSPIWSTFSFDS